jgi:hypothetical protein
MTPIEHAIMSRMEMNETNDCSVLARRLNLPY